MAARTTLLLALALSLPAGCRRLNPEWCASGTRCAPGEVCDPATNTCIRLEGGVKPEARLLDAPAEQRWDLPRADHKAQDRGRDTHVESCGGASGGWVCAGGAAYQCSETSPIKRRLCPQGRCDDGHCLLPLAPKTCKRNQDCVGPSMLCTVLLDGGQPKPFCAAAVIGLPAPATCTAGVDCASGLCTSSGQCYYACDAGADCPPSYTCQAITVDVEGVSASLKSCELP